MSKTSELTDAQKAELRIEAEAFALGYTEGKGHGRYEAHQDLLSVLKPYVQHVGNCGAVGGDPENSRCLCGLRQVWMS